MSTRPTAAIATRRTTERVVNASRFGGMTSAAVQNAINSIESGTVVLDSGVWAWTTPVTIKQNVKIRGHERATAIVVNQDIQLFKTDDTIDAPSPGIEFVGLLILDGCTSRTKYHFELANTQNILFSRIWMNVGQMTQNDVAGIRLYKATTLTEFGGTFLARIEKCVFSGASIDLNISDSWITECAVWAPTRAFAIHLGSSSCNVHNNQIVGSSLKAGVWISDTTNNFSVEGIRIFDNYFDGSYASVDSGRGVLIENGGIRNSQICNNWFWNQMDEGIWISANTRGLLINGNVFQDCGRRAVTTTGAPGSDDIKIEQSANFREGSISNNHFSRYAYTYPAARYAVNFNFTDALTADRNVLIESNIIASPDKYLQPALRVPNRFSYKLRGNIDTGAGAVDSTITAYGYHLILPDVPVYRAMVDAAQNTVIDQVTGGLRVDTSRAGHYAEMRAYVHGRSDTISWYFRTMDEGVLRQPLELLHDGDTKVNGLLRVGDAFLWVHDGKLRISPTRPVNLATDGAVVGTQT